MTNPDLLFDRSNVRATADQRCTRSNNEFAADTHDLATGAILQGRTRARLVV